MKMSSLAIVLSIVPFVLAADAQQATPPKVPLGVPADAKAFNGRWYRVYLEKVTWHRAKEKCIALGGRLTVVPDSSTWDFIKTLSSAALWLGATDEQAEGAWKWIDGTPLTFAAWVTNNPNNTGGNENYLAMVTNERTQGWNDFNKDGRTKTLQVSGFVCEWKPR